MKFIGLLRDYNPQAQYKDNPPDSRKERLIAGFTHTFSSGDLVNLVRRALDTGIIEAHDLPLTAVELLKAAQTRAERDYTEGENFRARLRVFHPQVEPAPRFKVVIDGAPLPSRDYSCLKAARGAALVSAQRNGKPTMVVTEHARFTIKKEVQEEN